MKKKTALTPYRGGQDNQTVLHLNNSARTSLRTTIPLFICRQFGLKKGDRVEWSIQSIKGQMFATIQRVANNIKQ